jgi:hypothetical protein
MDDEEWEPVPDAAIVTVHRPRDMAVLNRLSMIDAEVEKAMEAVGGEKGVADIEVKREMLLRMSRVRVQVREIEKLLGESGTYSFKRDSGELPEPVQTGVKKPASPKK